MDPQAATTLGQVDQGVEHRRCTPGQRGELVNHHHDRRRRSDRVVTFHRCQVLHPGPVQQPQAPVDLGLEAQPKPLGLVDVEVGDHARHVWQTCERAHARAALEVDKHEVEPLR